MITNNFNNFGTMNSSLTEHIIYSGASQRMRELKDNSIALVVTSPPYPMIEMWDEILGNQNSKIKSALNDHNGPLAFELMHSELDKIWSEVERVLIPGGFACINIGDATRTINGDFAIYSNHSRIITAFQKLQMTNLPNIIWRKQTNAPNKFMGSGMLPAGAYVTLEHEWILVFRKEGKRQFKTPEEKLRRKNSSFFWEERNIWFSDLWDLKGIKQKVENSETRSRSAAFPFEIPYRLINMYSLQDDTVLDPFLGMGTTILASIASKRNSVGYEIDPLLANSTSGIIDNTPTEFFNNCVAERLEKHRNFVNERLADPKKEELKHYNINLGVPVMTSQETDIRFCHLERIERNNFRFVAMYKDLQSREVLQTKPTRRESAKTLFDS